MAAVESFRCADETFKKKIQLLSPNNQVKMNHCVRLKVRGTQ